MRKVPLLLLILVSLAASGCIAYPSYWGNYQACRNVGGYPSGGRCFGSPQEASAYWQTRQGLAWRDFYERKNAERARGVNRALQDYHLGR